MVVGRSGPHLRRVEHQENENGKQEYQKERTDKTQLFGINGKNKIRVTFRQEFKLALCALRQPLTEKAPRTNADFRLDNVIPGTKRVALRIEKYPDPLFLILDEIIPDHRHGSNGQGNAGNKKAHRHTGQKHHPEATNGQH